MSLIQELLALRQSKLAEEATLPLPIDQVWKDNGSNSKTYISNVLYLVRPEKGGDKFEVVIEKNNARKPFASLTKANLDKSFIPLRASQAPDAEGFTQYRDLDETEAFKYTAETINVDNDGTVVTLNKGDYLLRRADGSGDFIYSVKKAAEFDANFEAQ